MTGNPNTLTLTMIALAIMVTLAFFRPDPLPPAHAANGQSAATLGNSQAAGYHYDDQDGAFLADVAAVASTGASLTASDTQASGRRTFYPAGRQSLSLFATWSASNSQACTVRLEYFGKHPTTGARVFQGHKDYVLTMDSTAQTSDAYYAAPRRLVDAGGARSIDVKVISLTNGTVKGVHVGSQ